jgi:WD40 repeat protein
MDIIMSFAEADAVSGKLVANILRSWGYAPAPPPGDAVTAALAGDETLLRCALANSAVVAVITPNWVTSSATRAVFRAARLLRRPILPIFPGTDGGLVIGSDLSRSEFAEAEAGGLNRLKEVIAHAADETREQAAPHRYKFKAFISYKHEDAHFAKWLHRSLERYRVPKGLVHKITEFGEVPRQLGRVFRDEEEARGASDLGALIRGALEESESLVVVCSPLSAKSPWVDEETKEFKRLGRESRIVPVILDGIPHHPTKECFPPSLKLKANATGALTTGVAEPLAVDWPKLGSARTLVKIVAGLTGLDFDQLWDRERRRRVRRSVAMAGMGVLVALATSVLLALLIRANGQADSETLANQSRAETDQGRHDGALRLALIAARNGWFTPPALGAEAALARAAQASSLIADLRGHSGPVAAVAFSSDGKTLATASADHTGRLWNAHTGAELFALKGHDGPVGAIAFSPDGSLVATASDDHTARLWDARTGAALAVLRAHDGPVKDVKFSPNGSKIATASDDGTARLWDSETHTALRVLAGNGSSVVAVAFSPDGARLATASNERKAQIWSTSTGAELHVLCCHEGLLTSVAYSPNGELVATAGRNSVRLWSTATGDAIADFEGHTQDNEPVEAYFDLKFSEDGSTLAAAGEYASALLVDVKGRTPRGYLCCHERGTSETSVWAVQINPAGNLVATAGQDGTARLWSASGRDNSSISVLRGHSGELTAVAFSPDGGRLATASKDGTARVWDVSDRDQIVRRGSKVSTDLIAGIAISPDGKRIAVAGPGSVARLLDPIDGTEILPPFQGHEDVLTGVAFSPKGTWFATASRDTTVRIWSVAAGGKTITLRHPNAVTALAFSPDGGQMATASLDGNIGIWDASSGLLLRRLISENKVLAAIAYSDDGRRLAVASENTARIRDVESGKTLTVLC